VNRHGRFFDVVCEAVDRLAIVVRDHRAKGYVHYRTLASDLVTVYRSPIPAPWAAQALERYFPWQRGFAGRASP
jgi:hypothetical protein